MVWTGGDRDFFVGVAFLALIAASYSIFICFR